MMSWISSPSSVTAVTYVVRISIEAVQARFYWESIDKLSLLLCLLHITLLSRSIDNKRLNVSNTYRGAVGVYSYRLRFVI
jgi:hypothetical protein